MKTQSSQYAWEADQSPLSVGFQNISALLNMLENSENLIKLCD